MTDRLTDDELAAVRKRSKSGLAPTYREVNRLLDEIEERRRADAKWREDRWDSNSCDTCGTPDHVWRAIAERKDGGA